MAAIEAAIFEFLENLLIYYNKYRWSPIGPGNLIDPRLKYADLFGIPTKHLLPRQWLLLTNV